MANESMKLAEIVARDRAVHVMFSVPIHVPIQESNECTRYESTRVEPEICYSLVQTHMLGGIA